MKMEELERLASSDKMIPGAPVEASRTISIEAPIAAVWRIQTSVEQWPSWYPYLIKAELDGTFAPGARISYGLIAKHRLNVAKVRDNRLVMLYGKYMGFSAVTKWEFSSLSTMRTKVTFAESSVGFLMAVVYSSGKLAEHLDAWLRALKTEAEIER